MIIMRLSAVFGIAATVGALAAGLVLIARDSEPMPAVAQPRFTNGLPRDLEAGLQLLEDTLPTETLDHMRRISERDMGEYHMSLGLGIRNSWLYVDRTPLRARLCGIGFRWEDDMSSAILMSLWRRLHGRPLALEEQAHSAQEYVNRAYADRRAANKEEGEWPDIRPSGCPVRDWVEPW